MPHRWRRWSTKETLGVSCGRPSEPSSNPEGQGRLFQGQPDAGDVEFTGETLWLHPPKSCGASGEVASSASPPFGFWRMGQPRPSFHHPQNIIAFVDPVASAAAGSLKFQMAVEENAERGILRDIK